MKTLLLIPAYNCERQIGRVLRGISPHLAARLGAITVLDNRSTDGTLEAARAAAAELPFPVAVRQNAANLGLGGSHKAAILEAVVKGFDYLAVLHGDDQAHSEELNLLLDEAESAPDAAAVLGARFMPGSRLAGYSRFRTFGNRAVNLLFSAVACRRIHDLGSGLNLYRIADLEWDKVSRFKNNLAFTIDLYLFYIRHKKAFRYVPISWREEDQLSNARCIRQGFAALFTLGKWRLGKDEANGVISPALLRASFEDSPWPAQRFA